MCKVFIVALATIALVGCDGPTPQQKAEYRMSNVTPVCYDGLEFLIYSKFKRGGGITQVMDANGRPKTCAQ